MDTEIRNCTHAGSVVELKDPNQYLSTLKMTMTVLRCQITGLSTSLTTGISCFALSCDNADTDFTFTMEDCNCSLNTGVYAGVFRLNGARQHLTLRRNHFLNNTASDSCGVFAASPIADATVEYNDFVGNTAPGYGALCFGGYPYPLSAGETRPFTLELHHKTKPPYTLVGRSASAYIPALTLPTTPLMAILLRQRPQQSPSPDIPRWTPFGHRMTIAG